MSPMNSEGLDNTVQIADGDDFIVLRVEENGMVTTISSLGDEDAVDILRTAADAIERDGFEKHSIQRLS